ncbi:MAG: hypothetical protein JNK38_13450 [Acidobacteria bacterium]|nr:hypothetical protein [Acidobacteriota bacterium]
MNKFKNCLLAALGISLLAFVLSVTGAGRAMAQSTFSLVKIINSTSEPVPTTVTNSPTVKLASNAAVTINNGESNPVLVQGVNDGVTPFHQSVSGNFPSGSVSASGVIPVPAGYRLVIEYVSASVLLPTGQNLHQASVSTQFKDVAVQHHLVRNEHGPHFSGNNNQFVVGQQVRLYADGGTPVIFSLARNNGTGSAGYSATVSGYLVNIP